MSTPEIETCEALGLEHSEGNGYDALLGKLKIELKSKRGKTHWGICLNDTKLSAKVQQNKFRDQALIVRLGKDGDYDYWVFPPFHFEQVYDMAMRRNKHFDRHADFRKRAATTHTPEDLQLLDEVLFHLRVNMSKRDFMTYGTKLNPLYESDPSDVPYCCDDMDLKAQVFDLLGEYSHG